MAAIPPQIYPLAKEGRQQLSSIDLNRQLYSLAGRGRNRRPELREQGVFRPGNEADKQQGLFMLYLLADPW